MWNKIAYTKLIPAYSYLIPSLYQAYNYPIPSLYTAYNYPIPSLYLAYIILHQAYNYPTPSLHPAFYTTLTPNLYYPIPSLQPAYILCRNKADHIQLILTHHITNPKSQEKNFFNQDNG